MIDGALRLGDPRSGVSLDLLPLLLERGAADAPDVAKVTEAERVYNAVREVAAPGPLDDDVSLVVVTFT